MNGCDGKEANVASDFMALYTTRQKYRRPYISPLDNLEGEISLIDGTVSH